MNTSPTSISPTVGHYAPARFDIPIKGMTRANADAVQAADKIAAGEVTPDAMVDLIGAQYDFQANAAVLKTMDENMGTLLNTFA